MERNSSGVFMDTGLQFDPQMNGEIGVKIPDDVKLRPFYFIKLLQKSMSTSAFISSEVFVSKQVWEQKQAQIASID